MLHNFRTTMSGEYLNRNICVAAIEGVGSPYGYIPSFGAGIAFCVVFGISMLAHAFVTIKNRTWWQFIFVMYVFRLSPGSRSLTLEQAFLRIGYTNNG